MAQPVVGQTVSLRPGLDGYLARPQVGADSPLVLVFMEAFGLNEYIRSVCETLAQQGYAALAPDFYHSQQYAYDDLTSAIATMQSLKDEVLMDEIEATIAYAAQQPGIDASRLGAVGFCMGGRLAFLTATRLGERLRAAVSFYGGSIGAQPDRFGRTPPLQAAAGISAPLLLLYGSEDASIPPDELARITHTLSARNKRFTLSVFPGAGHGFACHLRGSYHGPSAEEAWTLTQAFFTKHL